MGEASRSIGLARLLDVPPGDIAIGGHRGVGMNLMAEPGQGGAPPKLVPPHRENTLRSFRAAAAAGAAYVEFDVQVTRDGVPVVWHDDALISGDPAAPASAAIAELSAAEFAALGAASRAAPPGAAGGGVLRRFYRAAPPHTPASPLLAWRCEREDTFPALADLFSGLPPSVGFDIEVKMATPDTLERTPPEEVARVVGPILAAVEAGVRGGPGGQGARAIVFSSFDPEVCAELRARQTRWPVLFLSTGGRGERHADGRRNSLAAALALARELRLAGVVVDTSALRECEEAGGSFVAEATAAGLLVLTYGLANSDPAWVRRQARLGVHSCIVDDVAALVRALGAEAGDGAPDALAPGGGEGGFRTAPQLAPCMVLTTL